MKSLYKRAQTATEYLIILAVVIIIALIVVGVLGGIPGIGGSTGTNINTAYWQTSDIGIDSLSVSATGGATIVLRNNLPNNIVLTEIFAGTTATSAASNNVSGNFTTDSDITTTSNLFTTATILAGRTLTLTGNLTDPLSICTSAGDSESLYFTFTYTDSETSASYTFDGDDEAYETTCAT